MEDAQVVVTLTVWSGRGFIENLLYFKMDEPVCRYENSELLYQINANECMQLLLKHNLVSTL